MSGVQCPFHRLHVLLSNEIGQVPENLRADGTQKRYFPHLFNTDDHQTYVGSLPDQHYYMPDGMSVDDRDAFRRWHDKLDTWLKLKEEASGYPEHCTTGHLQREHVRRLNERENIVLHHANIRKNAGQRALAKLMLNSMWGRFGQQTNKTQVKEFIDLPDLWQFLDSSSYDVRWVSPVTEERVEIHYKMHYHCESDSPNLNIFVACFTTCHARLHPYRALNHLDPRALYSDTDSVVFVEGPDDPPVQPPLGDFLGDFTDELDPGDHIMEFCSGGGWVGRYTLFKSKKHASSNNTQLVSMEGVFEQVI